MLLTRWTETLDQHADAIAISHAEIPNARQAWTFAEVESLADEIAQKSNPQSDDPYLIAQADRADFIPTILAGWKCQRPVLLLETSHCQPRPISGGIPQGTIIIKQACGATGLERSLFLGASQILAEADRNIRALGLHPGRVGVAAISLAHTYGLGCLALPVLLGGVPIDILSSPMPMFIQQSLEKKTDAFLPGVPTLWKTWCLMKVLDGDCISLAVSAGSPLSLDLETQIWESVGIKLHNFYGTSETGAIAFDRSTTPRRDGSLLGDLLEGVQIEIITSNGSQDRLLVRSDAIALGADQLQRKQEFATSAYLTMDQGSLENGQVFWKNHIGEAINVAGRKVSPGKVQRVCESMPGVRAARVFRTVSRDAERFEEVSIELEFDRSENPKEALKALKKWAYQRLESWEMPRHWNV